jgi:hypothetical protein
MLNWLKNIFQQRFVRPRGILLYATVQEVIQSFQILGKEKFEVKLVAPPPEFRQGCDLAIEFELIEQEAVENILKNSNKPALKVISTREMLPDILKRSQIVPLGDCLMCKAGNMKITINKASQQIVNISGGGCPDIPYVAQKLHGLKINEALAPVEIGNSLCSYMLQIAFDALKKHLEKRC